MNPSVQVEEEIFIAAIALAPADRSSFILRQCGHDPAAVERILALVRGYERNSSFLETPPPAEERRVTRDFATTLPAEPRPGDRIGHYQLLERIGEGGFSVVFLTVQSEPVRRRVALKILRLGMDTHEFIARFEAERQTLALMEHPNIARVFDAGATETGRPYLVMELIHGLPITAYCDEHRLTFRARLELFIQVCGALQHAHQKGVIHRDLKPSNILVAHEAGAPLPKLIDFGIAKATQRGLTEKTIYTKFQQFIGTPAYMSPEQAEMNGLDIDTRSDIYSLGVLLYELVAGRTPFDTKELLQQSIDEIRRTIREQEPPRPSNRIDTMHGEELMTAAHLRSVEPRKLVASVRGDLDWIVMKCLEKDRTRRYATTNALAVDVQRFLAHEPIAARPPSTAYRVRKFVRRHRLGFAAGVGIIMSLVAGLTIATTSLLREKAAGVRAIAAESAERMGRKRAEAAETSARRSEAAARQAHQLAEGRRVGAENLLSFIFTDLGEQLGDYGQLQVLQQVSAKTMAYFESLPEALQSRETRAGYAFAIAGGGATLGWGTSIARWGDATARIRLERAIAIFDELEASGPLTSFMRVAFASVLSAMATQEWEEGHHPAALQFCKRGEGVVGPALTDEQWGGRAHHTLTALIYSTAFNLLRAGRPADAMLEFERALASAAEADRQPSSTIRRGLRAAQIKVRLVEALWRNGEREKARILAKEVDSTLRTFVRQEPFLVSARYSLAALQPYRAWQALAQWRFDDFLRTIEERQSEYLELQKLEPRNLVAQFGLGTSWGNARAGRSCYDWMTGDFSRAETSLQTAIALLSVEWATAYWRPALLELQFDLARVLAATGRNEEAARQLDAAAELRNRIIVERGMVGAEAEFRRISSEGRRRDVDFERLDWAALRRGAEDTIERIASMNLMAVDQAQANSLWNAAHLDLIRAAFEMGDYSVALRALNAWSPDRLLGSTDDIQQRFDRLGVLLLRIHVLARAGNRERGRLELARLWPEVENLFSAGPDYLFNQVQTARALSIRAEIDGTVIAKRAWLDRAAGFLRPAAAAGRLTRYEREVLLAGIERQLAGLPMP